MERNYGIKRQVFILSTKINKNKLRKYIKIGSHAWLWNDGGGRQEKINVCHRMMGKIIERTRTKERKIKSFLTEK